MSHGPEETHKMELDLDILKGLPLKGLAAMARCKCEIPLEAGVEERAVNCQLEGTSPILRNIAVDLGESSAKQQQKQL